MNTNNTNISLFAAGAAGVALFAAANSSFVASLPVGSIIGAGAALAAVAIFFRDYSRPSRDFSAPADILRPTLPTTAACCAGAANADHRRAA